MDQAALKELASHIETSLPDEVSAVTIAWDEVTIDTRPEYLIAVISFLKDDGNCRFHQLLDICGADYPERSRRFDVVIICSP